jgi:hypothetical protein
VEGISSDVPASSIDILASVDTQNRPLMDT